MNRREFNLALSSLALAAPASAVQLRSPWEELERECRGRLGVAVLTPGGAMSGHRLGERFPMCSTFKWVVAALTMQRVDRGVEKLDRRVHFGRDALLPYAPVSEKHVDAGMTVEELCEAAVEWSDNTAANLLLASFGGPPAFTRFARSLGDNVTRLDRVEPELNESRPGDPRDTTSPEAMARLLRAVLTGNALSERSRARLDAWMQSCRTDGERLRARLPPGWRLGSKTGTGSRGSTNDVGYFYAPDGTGPTFVAVYITDARAPRAQLEAAIAEVGRRVTGSKSS